LNLVQLNRDLIDVGETRPKTSLGRLFQIKGAEYEYERLANSVFVLWNSGFRGF